MTMDLCSFEISTSFSDSTHGFMLLCIDQVSLACKKEGFFHQIYGSLVNSAYCLN